MSDDLFGSDEERLAAVMSASLSAMFSAIRPMVKARIRSVLERNESLVYQGDAALEHLSSEILDCVLPPDIESQLKGE